MKPPPQRVLVTGADGFLGRAVVRALAKAGVEVLALGRRPGPPPPCAAMRVIADLADPSAPMLDLDALAVDAIAHCAGAVGEPQDAIARRRLYASNLDAVERILDAAETAGRRPRTLVVASAAIYETGAGAPVGEDAPWRPVGTYGVSKAAGAMAARMRRDARGLDVVIAVPFNVLGAGQPEALVPQTFVSQIAAAGGARGRLRVGDLSPVRDWIDVEDVADAIATLTLGDAPDPVYNICTGRGTTVGEVVDRLLALSGARLRPETDAVRFRTPLAPYSVGDPSRLRAATGWRSRWTLDESLRAMLVAAGITVGGGDGLEQD